MDGPKVWDFAVHTVPRAMLALLAEHGLKASDLDLVILHQSNLRMIQAIMEAIGLPGDRAVTTVECDGNTAAASIPLTLARALETGRLPSGSRHRDVSRLPYRAQHHRTDHRRRRRLDGSRRLPRRDSSCSCLSRPSSTRAATCPGAAHRPVGGGSGRGVRSVHGAFSRLAGAAA
jgi:hypothetical protein